MVASSKQAVVTRLPSLYQPRRVLVRVINQRCASVDKSHLPRATSETFLSQYARGHVVETVRRAPPLCVRSCSKLDQQILARIITLGSFCFCETGDVATVHYARRKLW